MTFGVTLFVSIAIVIILQLNGELFIKSTIYNGGTRGVGTVHTGDWIIHQLPALEVTIISLLMARTSSIVFSETMEIFTKCQKVIYSIYFLACSLFILTLYMLTMDFASNYPNDLPVYVTCIIVFFSSLLINSILYLFYYFYPNSNLTLSTNY